MSPNLFYGDLKRESSILKNRVRTDNRHGFRHEFKYTYNENKS